MCWSVRGIVVDQLLIEDSGSDLILAWLAVGPHCLELPDQVQAVVTNLAPVAAAGDCFSP